MIFLEILIVFKLSFDKCHYEGSYIVERDKKKCHAKAIVIEENDQVEISLF